MSRILTLGYELPELSDGAVEARSNRTRQFIEPLLADGHQVCLVVSHPTDQSEVPHTLGPALSYHRLNMQTLGWRRRAGRLVNAFQPEGVLAVMFNSCLRAARLVADRPLWMDLFGDKIAETQVAEYVRDSTRGSRIMFRYLRQVLTVGDVYSTCSLPQKHALVGELGMAKRLNRRTLGYEFVHAILPGAAGNPAPTGPAPANLGAFPPDAFVVLWCGGYNVWTDVDTLFRALTLAMERNQRVVFVSVGAGVNLEDNHSYERFLAMIAASPFSQRFHMQGWQPAKDVPGYYALADVGINLDTPQYETQLGTRTRLVEMMQHGLPVITTRGCELSDIIHANGLGLAAPIGDSDRLASHILSLADDPAARQTLAEKARTYVTEQLSFSQTTRPFRSWANKPYHAPDRGKKNADINPREIEYALRSLVRQWLWDLWALERGE